MFGPRCFTVALCRSPLTKPTLIFLSSTDKEVVSILVIDPKNVRFPANVASCSNITLDLNTALTTRFACRAFSMYTGSMSPVLPTNI